VVKGRRGRHKAGGHNMIWMGEWKGAVGARGRCEVTGKTAKFQCGAAQSHKTSREAAQVNSLVLSSSSSLPLELRRLRYCCTSKGATRSGSEAACSLSGPTESKDACQRVPMAPIWPQCPCRARGSWPVRIFRNKQAKSPPIKYQRQRHSFSID